MNDLIKGRTVEQELNPGPHTSRVAVASGATVVRLALPSDPDAERWGMRARSLKGFTHPAIARVRGGGTWDKKTGEPPFIAYEYVTGPLLSDITDDIDGATSDEIMRALSQGVEALHEAGMVHGMIHPGQVRLNDQGAPVLLDAAATWDGAASSEKGDAEALVALALSLPPGEWHDTWKALEGRVLSVGEINSALAGEVSAATSLAPPPVAESPAPAPKRRKAPRLAPPPTPADATPDSAPTPVSAPSPAPAPTPPPVPASPTEVALEAPEVVLEAPEPAPAPSAPTPAPAPSAPTPAPAPSAPTLAAAPTPADDASTQGVALQTEVARLTEQVAAKDREIADLKAAKEAAELYSASLQEHQTKAGQAQEDVTELRTTITTLTGELDTARQEHQALTGELATTQAQVAAAEARAQAAEERAQTHQDRISALESQVAHAQTTAAAGARDAAVARETVTTVQAQLAQSQQSLAREMLNSGRLNTQLHEVRQELEQAQATIRDLRAAPAPAPRQVDPSETERALRDQLATLSAQLEDAHAQTAQARRDATTAQEQFARAQTDLAEAAEQASPAPEELAALQAQLAQVTTSYEQLQQDKARMEEELEQARAQAAVPPPPTPSALGPALKAAVEKVSLLEQDLPVS